MFQYEKAIPAIFTFGILALLIENGRVDWRETIIELCLLNHSAAKIGFDLYEAYQNVRPFGSHEGVGVFDEYFEHGSRDIHAMGYEESSDEHGFKYRQNR